MINRVALIKAHTLNELKYAPESITAQDRLFLVSGIEKLQHAAEQVIIAHGMGWDMDGVIEELRSALPEGSICRES